MADALPPVLVTDDNPQAREIYLLILEGFGIPAIEAKDVSETLHLCQTQPIALVVSDIVKPGMDGYALLTQMRDNPITAHIPVMIVSSIGSMVDVREKALSLGAARCISKPVNPRTFAADVCSVAAEHGIVYTPSRQLRKH